MPVPQTGYDQANPNTPLWTFDAEGNLNLAGAVTIDAPLSIDGRSLEPGTALVPSSDLPLSAFLRAPSSYAPAEQTTLTVTAQTMTAVSSSNINTGSFTAPASGSVVITVQLVCALSANSQVAFGLAAHGTVTPLVCNSVVSNPTTSITLKTLVFLVTGLTPGTSYSFDLLAAVPSGDTLTVYAFGTTSTTPTLSSGGAGAPVTMTVQAV
jgi:hypothetical protein